MIGSTTATPFRQAFEIANLLPPSFHCSLAIRRFASRCCRSGSPCAVSGQSTARRRRSGETPWNSVKESHRSVTLFMKRAARRDRLPCVLWKFGCRCPTIASGGSGEWRDKRGTGPGECHGAVRSHERGANEANLLESVRGWRDEFCSGRRRGGDLSLAGGCARGQPHGCRAGRRTGSMHVFSVTVQFAELTHV